MVLYRVRVSMSSDTPLPKDLPSTPAQFEGGEGNEGLKNRHSAVFISTGAHVCLIMCISVGILYLPERLPVL